MEDHSNQVAEKTEEQSGSVLLTYFEGDISSMVDEHFTRALSQAKNPKGERFKNKRNRKSAQTIESKQWKTQSETEFQTMFSSERLQHGASSNPHMSLSHAPNGTHIWPGSTRQNINLPLPPMVYPSAVSPGGVMVAEHQYTNSFLYNDHSDLGSAVMNPTKQDLISGWPKHPGFGSQMSSDFGLDSGVQMIENKNLYWY